MPTRMSGGRTQLLRALNPFGLDHRDPVPFAARGDERPLLLIGAHGTATSELLNPIATALGLEYRPYNPALDAALLDHGEKQTRRSVVIGPRVDVRAAHWVVQPCS